jgi:hypothetical protein
VAPQPDTQAPGAGAQAALRAGIAQRDVSLGLGADGPVIAAAESSALASVAPVRARAVFEVTADASGVVTGVRLADASEDWRGWETVGRTMSARLAKTRLRIAAGAKGVSMSIEVVSRWQLPSGNDPEVAVSVAGIPVKKTDAKHPVHVDILKPVLKMGACPTLGPSTGEGSAPSALPCVSFGINIFSTNVDPTDLAPRPLQVVHARVLREAEL